MATWRRLHNRLALPLLVALAMLVQQPALAGTVKIGVLKFGTVSWELDTIKTHGLDKAEGLDLQVVELANTNATSVALLAGGVDVIVTDWLWVTRQRADGARFIRWVAEVFEQPFLLSLQG